MRVAVPTGAVMYWNNREQSRDTFLGEWTRSGDKYIQDEMAITSPAAGGMTCSRSAASTSRRSKSRAHFRPIPTFWKPRSSPGPMSEALIKPKAFVVLKTADKACDALARELQDHVKAKLAPYKYPRWIEFRSSLPKTATGKIQRFMLRAEQSPE